jgi:hypothetical protein
MKNFNLILDTLYFKPITTTYNHNHTNTNIGQRQIGEIMRKRLENMSGKYSFGSPLKVDAPKFNHSIIHTSTALGSLIRPQRKGQGV